MRLDAGKFDEPVTCPTGEIAANRPLITRIREGEVGVKRMLRQKLMLEMVGLSESTIRRMEKEGKFPKRRSLGTRAKGWTSAEIEQWMEDRPTVV